MSPFNKIKFENFNFVLKLPFDGAVFQILYVSAQSDVDQPLSVFTVLCYSFPARFKE
jgi:hypothetical protein